MHWTFCEGKPPLKRSAVLEMGIPRTFESHPQRTLIVASMPSYASQLDYQLAGFLRRHDKGNDPGALNRRGYLSGK